MRHKLEVPSTVKPGLARLLPVCAASILGACGGNEGSPGADTSVSQSLPTFDELHAIVDPQARPQTNNQQPLPDPQRRPASSDANPTPVGGGACSDICAPASRLQCGNIGGCHDVCETYSQLGPSCLQVLVSFVDCISSVDDPCNTGVNVCAEQIQVPAVLCALELGYDLDDLEDIEIAPLADPGSDRDLERASSSAP